MSNYTVMVDCGPDLVPTVSWHDHGIGLFFAFSAIAALDFVVCRRMIPANPSARWFLLHSAFNWAVVAASMKDVVAVFAKPLCSLAVPMESWIPAYLVIAGHAYHALAFDMKPSEVRHHLIFSGLGGGLTLSMAWGPLMSLCLFLISGLPGAIDYALLAAVKTGNLDRMTEKKANTAINTYLRMPGLVTVSAFASACLAHGLTTHLNSTALAFCITLPLANGLFYGEQIIGSYHKELALQAKTKAS